MAALKARYSGLLIKARQRLDEIKRLMAEGLICLNGDFVPSVHYPPITRYPRILEEELFNGYTLPYDGLVDIYVHFPFCRQRCTFCHYPGKLGLQNEEKNRYLDALEKEMDIYMRRLGVDKVKPRSILIGGGTPTYLTPEQLTRFLEFFSRRIDFTFCRQFNYDVDPGSLVGKKGLQRLQIMKDYGVNRLTIGVQSLNDSVLKVMNRPHDVQTAIESVENSRRFGYQLNIEFIYGHPEETIENWIDVIEKAVILPVDEIQLYRLKVLAYGDLQGDILKLREDNPASFPSFDETMMMKHIASEILQTYGFHENLRRVYSKEKKHFSHYAYNQCCMLYDQIGFGLTAFSSLRDRFALNTQNFSEYYEMIEAGRLPVNRGYIRDLEQQVRWAVILPLKNSEIKKAYFEKVTGLPFDSVFRKKVGKLKQFGLIKENDTSVCLTGLGAFVADEVAEQFYSNEFKPFASDAYARGPLHPYADNKPEDALGWKMFRGQTTECSMPDSNDWDLPNMNDQELLFLLTARGDRQQELFVHARAVRKRYFKDVVQLRGVIEISNICRKNCDYCAMRCCNSTLERFRLDPDTILSAAASITETGITTVFLQAGQDPLCDPYLEEVVPAVVRNLGAEVILCVGERNKETYQRFARFGAGSFILKFETSDARGYERMVHTALDLRIKCMQWIRQAGMRIGTGNIAGLPGQSWENLISDLRFIFGFHPDFASTAPFIPNKGTPFQSNPPGDINLALNIIALLRIGLKDCLIPAVSALECIHSGGQLMGLNAGANVLTVNFTPWLYRNNYRIYSEDRFIVNLNHAANIAHAAGLRMGIDTLPKAGLEK
ncbi:MAG: radical SAM protein [bacterium]